MARFTLISILVCSALCGLPCVSGFAQDARPAPADRAAAIARADELNSEVRRLHATGRYAEAIPQADEACALLKRALGPDHPAYAESLNNRAMLDFGLGDTEAARKRFEEAAAIYARRTGEVHQGHAAALSNLALIVSEDGDFRQAAKLYDRALQIIKQTAGDDHQDTAMVLLSIAVLHQKLGDYAAAEPLYLRALEIFKQVHGEGALPYAVVLHNLAAFYRMTGDYARAEPLYRQCLKVFQAQEHRHYYLSSVSNLAILYQHVGDYEQAVPLFLEARDLAAALYPAEHPAQALHLNNLSSLYQLMERPEDAREMLLMAKAVLERGRSKDHPLYATIIGNLAGLHFDAGDYEQAEPLCREVCELRKQTLGEQHPDYAAGLNNLAHVLAAMNRTAEAESLLRRALTISRRSLDATALVQSERQQLAMGRGLRYQLDNYVSLGLNYGTSARSIWAEVLRWKGSTLVRQRAMRLAGNDPAVQDLFAQLQRTGTQLASLSRAVPTEEYQKAIWRTALDHLMQEKELLEARLSAQCAAFREAGREITLDALSAALPPEAVLVDFLEFTRNTPSKEKGKPPTFERQLVAFVVRHANKPEDEVAMVALGPVAPIGAAIDRWRRTFGVGDEAAAAGAELRRLVWEPVAATMNEVPATKNEEPSTKISPTSPPTPGPSPTRGEGSQTALSPPTTHHPPPTLLVSTDGVLGRLSLGALPGCKPGTYLIEDHRLAMIPVPQLLPALVGGEESRELDRELLLLGDVDYDAAPGAADSAVQKKKQPRRAGDRAASPTEGKLFDPLANTAGEIAAIEKLYGRLFDVNPDDPKSLVRTGADEAHFRALAPQYRHLHLATHGFFAGAEYESAERSRSADARGDRALLADRESEVVGHNPGLLSGLALAGANREPVADADDGILTSQEIGVMNLSGVDTVVLSACDTGLGETAGGEGLLGVQRAFQVAGARTTVASFWKVDDLVTRLLMERFYRNLWEGEMSRLDALREAQIYVLNHPEAIRGSDPQPNDPQIRTNPRYWAAFTLSGDWR